MAKEQGNVIRVSKSTIQRLPVYLSYLKSQIPANQVYISATAIANALGLGEVQVRKDLAQISNQGRPKVGYVITDLVDDLEDFLGYKDASDAIIVGVGKLGAALLDYKGFDEYGLNVVAGFDIEDMGQTDSGKRIFSTDQLEEMASRLHIRIGIICVPGASAQSVCDMLVRAGVVAILNFAPVHLIAPEGVIIQNENIAASLAVLSSRLQVMFKNEKREQQEEDNK